jgi:hypothetical protein
MTTNIKAIAELSAKLTELITQLNGTHSVSVLDKELLKQYCVEAYEQVLLLTPTLNNEQVEQKPVEELFEKQEEIVERPFSFVNQELLFVATKEVNQEMIEPAPQAEMMDLKTETELQNELIDDIIEQQQESDILTQPPVLLKEVIHELSLHEKIATSLTQRADLSERLAKSASPSLKSAIHVNLKIAIVNDLFKENTVEYVKAIDKLNASENIHEAMRYFTELKHNYDWQTDNSLVKELETLINKRFL